MALGRKCGGGLKEKRGVNHEERLGLELGSVRYTRGLGRKRILISNDLEMTTTSPISDSAFKTPLKKRCAEPEVMDVDSEKSLLESVPQDILIRILCGVDHDDLKRLFHVSSSIREATLIAKKSHFAYSTPSKIRAFGNTIDLDDSKEFVESEEAPNAPKQPRPRRSRLNHKKLADISVALFSSPNEDQWPKNGLLIDTEI